MSTYQYSWATPELTAKKVAEHLVSSCKTCGGRGGSRERDSAGAEYYNPCQCKRNAFIVQYVGDELFRYKCVPDDRLSIHQSALLIGNPESVKTRLVSCLVRQHRYPEITRRAIPWISDIKVIQSTFAATGAKDQQSTAELLSSPGLVIIEFKNRQKITGLGSRIHTALDFRAGKPTWLILDGSLPKSYEGDPDIADALKPYPRIELEPPKVDQLDAGLDAELGASL